MLVSKFSNFFLFHPPLFIQYSTEECSTVQYKAAGPVRAVISIRYGSKEGVQGRQTDGSKTEATLILCGYSGERANNRGDSTIKEEDEEKKN